MGFIGTIAVIYHIILRYLQSKKEQNRMDNIEKTGMREVALTTRDLAEWQGRQAVMSNGMIMICRRGRTEIEVNFSSWQLAEGSVITLFPNDMICMARRSDDFLAETLEYSSSLLREASLQLEQTVYFQLRTDRCRTDSPILTNIINTMFQLLRLYFNQPDCICLDQLVLLQLKSFFMGFYDYIYRNPMKKSTEDGSPRTRELFNRFMMELEMRFRQSRDVTFYAGLLNITPKYLNVITQRISGKTVKALINEYVVLQLKVELNSRKKSAKELAWEYNFSDLSFFCRYFKQHTGMTTMQFLKNKVEV